MKIKAMFFRVPGIVLMGGLILHNHHNLHNLHPATFPPPDLFTAYG